MKWNSFTYRGKDYHLNHLDPFEWVFNAPKGPGRPKCQYKFQVTFSMHCFTRGCLPDENIAAGLIYEGPYESRVFCFDRHALSNQLPTIVKEMGNRPCWITHHRNFFTIEVCNQAGEKVEYEVYFDVTRATRRGWLNLAVQSAYIRTSEYGIAQPRKRKIGLAVIAYKRQRREEIKPPR